MIQDGLDCDFDEAIKLQRGKESSTIEGGTIATEITVSAKTENSRVIEKGLHYGPLTISPDSYEINHLIAVAIVKLGTHPYDEAPEIVVKTKTIWQS